MWGSRRDRGEKAVVRKDDFRRRNFEGGGMISFLSSSFVHSATCWTSSQEYSVVFPQREATKSDCLISFKPVSLQVLAYFFIVVLFLVTLA